MCRNAEVSSLNPITLFNSCNDSLFAGMTLCTRARFTALVSYSDELAVDSPPVICLQRQGAKLASRLFYRSPLLRKYNMATNLQMFTKVTIVDVLPHVTVEGRHLWQALHWPVASSHGVAFGGSAFPKFFVLTKFQLVTSQFLLNV